MDEVAGVGHDCRSMRRRSSLNEPGQQGGYCRGKQPDSDTLEKRGIKGATGRALTGPEPDDKRVCWESDDQKSANDELDVAISSRTTKP